MLYLPSTARMGAPEVVVQNPDDGNACAFDGGAFGVHDLPDISSRFAPEPHLKMPYRRFGVIAHGTATTERRWDLAGDLHAAVRHEPTLAHGDGGPARLTAQGGDEIVPKRCHSPLLRWP